MPEITGYIHAFVIDQPAIDKEIANTGLKLETYLFSQQKSITNSGNCLLSAGFNRIPLTAGLTDFDFRKTLAVILLDVADIVESAIESESFKQALAPCLDFLIDFSYFQRGNQYLFFNQANLDFQTVIIDEALYQDLVLQRGLTTEDMRNKTKRYYDLAVILLGGPDEKHKKISKPI